MNYLSADSVSKSFGEKKLFQNISFGISRGQKVALVAKNGSGKTTLMRIIAGLDTPDTGEIALQQEARLVYLPQVPDMPAGLTISEYMFDSAQPELKATKAYEEALKEVMENPSDAADEALQAATEQMDTLKAWDTETKVQQVLTMLNVRNLTQELSQLSGGQQKRVALARVLLDEPDLLILDEPTNHLDLAMTEWLEDYLVRARTSLLLVTHDRYFLDRICTDIFELAEGELHRHPGNYSKYLERRQERLSTQQQMSEKARNLLKTELEWARRMPKARGTKAKYRMDAVDDLQEKARGRGPEQKVQLQVKMQRMGGKVLEVDGMKKSFGKLQILNNFSHTFKRGERIGIIGPNGVGKSTFLNMLLSLEKPDAGTVVKGETIVFGYFSQHATELDGNKRVIEIVQDIAEVITMANGSTLSASELLKTFLFAPDQQYAYVRTLSGGEKRRLQLLTVLVANPNFLVLDEPTNDLDLETLQVLEQFLENYSGCLIIVTHDRYFLDRLADHLFVFEGEGEVRSYNGTYNQYIAEKEEEKKAAEEAPKPAAL